MKFAHLADCHVGSWREPALREAGAQAFCMAIDTCLKEGVDFILICGDLFNTAQPGMDHLRSVVEGLKKCADSSVPVYIISGSHDYSPSGKTMLDVLDAAGLVRNTAKACEAGNRLQLLPTVDKKTGAKIFGMVGRKGGLEREYFENINLQSIEAETGKKILMFHSAVLEHRPSGFDKMDAVPLSLFPKGFDYYAGSHIHIVSRMDENGYGLFAVPGPLFPANFQELEGLKHGGFYIFDNGNLKREEIILFPVHSICIQAHGMTPGALEAAITKEAGSVPAGAVVTLRIEGTLLQGKTSDVQWARLYEGFMAKGARCVLRNAAKLASPEMAQVRVQSFSVEQIESILIEEHAGKTKVFSKEDEAALIKSIMLVLSSEKGEGETAASYEERISNTCETIIFNTKKPVTNTGMAQTNL